MCKDVYKKLKVAYMLISRKKKCRFTHTMSIEIKMNELELHISTCINLPPKISNVFKNKTCAMLHMVKYGGDKSKDMQNNTMYYLWTHM